MEARFFDDGYDYGDQYDSEDSEEEMIRYLFQPSFTGWTPLHFAADEGHFHLLQALLDCGMSLSTDQRQPW